MTTIAKRFIEAADTIRRMHVTGAEPKAFGNAMPDYFHTALDRGGWRKEAGDSLQPEDWDRYTRELRRPEKKRPPTAGAISRLEECERWVAEMVQSEKQRAALWAWARAKVSGKPFNAWCVAQGISPGTGKDRKNRAMANIYKHLGGRDFLHTEGADDGGFTDPPVQDHVRSTFGHQRGAHYDRTALYSPDNRDEPDQSAPGERNRRLEAARRRQSDAA